MQPVLPRRHPSRAPDENTPGPAGRPPGCRRGPSPAARSLLLVALVAALAATVLPLVAARPAAAATCAPTDPTCNLQYRIRTKLPSGAPRTVEATIGVPAFVDAYGDANPDLVVQLAAAPGSATTLTFSVRRVNPSSWRLSVEAVLPVPGKPGEFVSFGYDGSECAIPGTFTESITIASVPGRTLDLTAVVDVEGAADCLAMTGAVFKEDGAGNRIDPLTVSMREAPVAPRSTVQFFATPQGHYWASVKPSTPVKLNPSITRVEGAEELRVAGTVDKLPVAGVTLNYEKQAGRITYGAQEPVDLLSVEVRQLKSAKLDTLVQTTLRSIPATVFTVTRSAPKAASFTSTRPIGSVEFGLATGGVVVPGPAAGDHFKLYEKEALLSVSGRLSGLTLADVSWDDPLRVRVIRTAGPFDIIADTNYRRRCDWVTCQEIWRSARVDVDDLPADVTLTYSLSAQTLTYKGGAGIAQIRAVVTDPETLGGSTTRVEALLQQLPTDVTVTVPPAGRSVSVHASAPIALVELLATNGPDERIPSPTDGVLIRNRDGRNVKFVRVNGLQRAEIDAGAVVHLDVVKNAARRFLIDMEETRLSGCATCIRDIHVDINWLPARIVLDFNPSTQTLSYDGSETISNITASLSDPTGLLNKQPHPIRKAFLYVQDLPKALSFTATPGTEDIAVNATAPIGFVGLKLTSGPDQHNLPDSRDGVRVDDMVDYFSAHVRLSGLTKAAVQKRKECLDFGSAKDCWNNVRAELGSAGGRPLHVELRSGFTGRTLATVDNMAPQVTLVTKSHTWADSRGVRDLASWTEVVASRASGALHLETNSGGRDKRVDLDLLPARLNLCSAPASSECTGSGRPAAKGSLTYDASERANLSLKQCLATNCETWLEIPSMSLRKLAFELNPRSSIAGEAFVDTDDEGLHGDIYAYEVWNLDKEIRLPPGFRAQDRFVKWTPFTTKTGMIHCPSNTRLMVKVLGVWINVAGFLC